MVIVLHGSSACGQPRRRRCLPVGLAVAVDGAIDDDVCVVRNTTGEPCPPPPAELLDYLRCIVNHPDVPDTVKADARDYLGHLEAASSGSGSLTGEARMNMAVSAARQHGREVDRRPPRPRYGTA